MSTPSPMLLYLRMKAEVSRMVAEGVQGPSVMDPAVLRLQVLDCLERIEAITAGISDDKPNAANALNTTAASIRKTLNEFIKWYIANHELEV